MATSAIRNNDPFTPADIARIEAYLHQLGVPQRAYSIETARTTGAGGPGTAYKLYQTDAGPLEVLIVGPDIKPLANPTVRGALARLGIESALAHEIVGHRGAESAGAGFDRSSALGLALDEAQAHYRAALHAPGLLGIERALLMQAARDELARLRLRIRDVRVWFHREPGPWRDWSVTPAGTQRSPPFPIP